MNDISPIAIQEYLGGIDYPAEKDDVVAHAQEKGAGEKVMNALEQLPDKTYENPSDVNEALT